MIEMFFYMYVQLKSLSNNALLFTLAELIPNDKNLTKNLEGKGAIRKVCNSKKGNQEKVKRGNSLIPMVNQSTSNGVDSSVIIYHTFH